MRDDWANWSSSYMQLDVLGSSCVRPFLPIEHQLSDPLKHLANMQVDLGPYAPVNRLQKRGWGMAEQPVFSDALPTCPGTGTRPCTKIGLFQQKLQTN